MGTLSSTRRGGRLAALLAGTIVLAPAPALAAARLGPPIPTVPSATVPTVPSATMPTVTTPRVTTPGLVTPAATAPGVTVPPVTLPPVTVPSVTVTVPPVSVPPTPTPPPVLPTTGTTRPAVGGRPGGTSTPSGSSPTARTPTAPANTGPHGTDAGSRAATTGDPATELVPRRHHLRQAAVDTAKALSFPLLLAIAVALFLLLQGRVGARDPNLALAPLAADDELLGFS